MTGIPVSREITHHMQNDRLREAETSRLAQQALRSARAGSNGWYVGSARRGLLVLWVRPDAG